MPLRWLLTLLLGIAALQSVSTLAGDKPDSTPSMVLRSSAQISDWKPILDDFQSTDEAKQAAAAKVIIEAGNSGYANVTPLIKKNDAELTRRVKEVQRQIEMRSNEMYQAICAKHEQALSKALDATVLEKLACEWESLRNYAPAPQLQQEAFRIANEMHRRSKNVDTATQKLNEIDDELQKTPVPTGVLRTSLLVNKSEMLMALQRNKDALAAAQEAIETGGKACRLTPLALKIQAEVFMRLNDPEHARSDCNKIIADFPRSLEVHFAQQAILDTYVQERRWDDALRQLKTYLAAFPIDEDSQQAANGLLKVLMDDEHDYKHATELAEWMMANLPLERIAMDVPRCFGGCNEYIFKDYNKAERGYAMLRDNFPDTIDSNDIKIVIARVQAKAAGKFPKEPDVADEGPSGALAQFLKAVRTRDSKAIGELVMADKIKEFAARLASPNDSLITSVTFSDVVVKHVELSSNKDSALIYVDVYVSAAIEPKTMFEAAMIEDGKWRIRWRDIDEDLPAADPKAAREEWEKDNSQKKPEKKDEKK